MLSNYDLKLNDVYRTLDFINISNKEFFLAGARYFCDDHKEGNDWEFVTDWTNKHEIIQAIKSDMLYISEWVISFPKIKIKFTKDYDKYVMACQLLRKQFKNFKGNLFDLDEADRNQLIEATMETLK